MSAQTHPQPGPAGSAQPISKSAKRRAKQRARQATNGHPSPNAQHDDIPEQDEASEPPQNTSHDHDARQDVSDYDADAGTNEASHEANDTQSSKKAKKKKKKKKSGVSGDGEGDSGGAVETLPRASGMSRDKIWVTSSQEERERIKEFWLGLGEEERKSLVKVEKDAVLRKMKEQQKHTCSCSVCGRKRTAIEEELEGLYDAYYNELEHYANRDPQPLLPNSRDLDRQPPLPPLRQNHAPPLMPQGPRPAPAEDDAAEEQDAPYSDGDLDDDDGYSDEEDAINPSQVPPDPETADFLAFGNSLQVQGGILTVADDLLKNDGRRFIEMMEQLAERRMAREEDRDLYSSRHYAPQTNGSNVAYGPPPPHSHGPPPPPPDEEEFDDDEEEDEDYEGDQDDDDDEYEEEEDAMTENQRMEEGRRMFQIFAARMFEQRVLTAYKIRVAKERQDKLLEELEEEDLQVVRQKAKKAKMAQKRKDKLAEKKKALMDQEAQKEKERLAEQARLQEEEEQKAEEARQRAEAKKKQREEQKKTVEADRRKKKEEQQERENQQRLARERERREREEQRAKEKEKEEETKREEQEQKERDAQLKAENEAKEREAKERGAKERGAKERGARERGAREREAKEREAKEREAKEREAREREAKEREDREREAKERDAKERDAKEREAREARDREKSRQEDRVPAKAAATTAGQPAAYQAAKKPPQAPVPTILPQHQPSQPASAFSNSPKVPVATPVLPKAPTPLRPRTTSQQVPLPPVIPNLATVNTSTTAVSASSSQQRSAGGASQDRSPHPITPVQSSPGPTAFPLRKSSVGPAQATASQAASPIGVPPPTSLPPGPVSGQLGTHSMYPTSHTPPHLPPGLPPPRPLDMGFSLGYRGPPPGVLSMPPGIAPPPIGPRGFMQPPPGFGLGPGDSFGPVNPATGPQKDMSPSSHSRHASSSFESPPNAGSHLMGKPLPIRRPGNVFTGASPRRDADDDVLPGSNLGSSALLEDSEDPLIDEAISSHLRQPPPGSRQAFMPGPYLDAFSMSANLWPSASAFTAPSGFGPIGSSLWGVPQPTTNLSTSLARPSVVSRSFILRAQLCLACKDLAASGVSTPDGYIDMGTVLAVLQVGDPGVTADFLLELCETEGTPQNGGGTFDVRRDALGPGKHAIHWDSGDDIPRGSVPGSGFVHRAVGAPGEILSNASAITGSGGGRGLL